VTYSHGVIHTCPRCELRFEREAELTEHLVNDHRFNLDEIRPHPVKVRKTGRRLVVVVGNHTLLSDALRDRLQTVTAGGDVDLHVVVPIRAADDLDVGFWRGRALAERLVEPGVELTVDVGVDEPVTLVQKAVHGAHIDQIILSTLPEGVSRWLEADVAGHMRHALNVPVEVVAAEG
jgi:uncharacterized C2H2 Zn-finger protein